jgi:hypothetical protein
MKYFFLLLVLTQLVGCLNYEAKHTEKKTTAAVVLVTGDTCERQFHSQVSSVEAHLESYQEATLNFQRGPRDPSDPYEPLDLLFELNRSRSALSKSCVYLTSQDMDKQCPGLDTSKALRLVDECAAIDAKAIKMPQGLLKFLYTREGACEANLSVWGIKFEKTETMGGAAEVQFALYLLPRGEFRLIRISKGDFGWSKVIKQGQWSATENAIILEGIDYKVTWNERLITMAVGNRMIQGFMSPLKVDLDGDTVERICNDVAYVDGWF